MDQECAGSFFLCISSLQVFLPAHQAIKINLSLSRMNLTFLPSQSYTSRANAKYFKQKLMNFATFSNPSFPWSQQTSSVYCTFCFTDPLCPVFQALLEAWLKFLMRRGWCLNLNSSDLGVKAVSNKEIKIPVLHSKISHPCIAETCLNDSETLRIPGT